MIIRVAVSKGTTATSGSPVLRASASVTPACAYSGSVKLPTTAAVLALVITGPRTAFVPAMRPSCMAWGTSITRPTTYRNIQTRNTVQIAASHSVRTFARRATERNRDQGVGDYNLPERRSTTEGSQWNTGMFPFSTLSSRSIHEARIEISGNGRETIPFSDAVRINVLDAFNGGGAQNRNIDRNRTISFGNMFSRLGETITQRGIGNGMSILIFSSIISRLPAESSAIYATNKAAAAVLLGLGILIIVAVVLVEQAQRRIPVQYAKRVVGRKLYGGSSTYIPMKVNQAGVIPIIFASSLLYLPVLAAAERPTPVAVTRGNGPAPAAVLAGCRGERVCPGGEVLRRVAGARRPLRRGVAPGAVGGARRGV